MATRTTHIRGGAHGVITVAAAGLPHGAMDGVDTRAQTSMDAGETAHMQLLAQPGPIRTPAIMAEEVGRVSRIRRLAPEGLPGAARTRTPIPGIPSAVGAPWGTTQARASS